MISRYLLRRWAGAIALLICITGLSETCNAQPADPDQILEMIAALSDPMSAEDLTAIYEAIGTVLEESSRLDLKSALHARLDALFDPKAPASPLTANAEEQVQELIARDHAGDGDPSLEMFEAEMTRKRLRMEIEMLPPGPDATVETLRLRDELFTEISQLPDPFTRDELLRLLEAQERAAAKASGTPSN